MSFIRKNPEIVIARAATFGFAETDVGHAREYLRYHEWGLSFEHVITRLHEYDCKIDQEFYEWMMRIGTKMEWSAGQYDFMRTLVREP